MQNKKAQSSIQGNKQSDNNIEYIRVPYLPIYLISPVIPYKVDSSLSKSSARDHLAPSSKSRINYKITPSSP